MAEHERGGERGRGLEGRTALVTGASSGLGRATAIALARAGADVALVARSAEELESAREEAPATRVLAPGQVADFIAWFVASPPEFVLTEGIVLPIEEGLP